MFMLSQRLRNMVLASFFISVCFFTFQPLSFAQGSDLEPNNSCLEVQSFGIVDLPFSVSGSLDLDPVESQLDVDFFRFTGTPGDVVQADLLGAISGEGTLGLPMLGLFDRDCNLIDVSYSDIPSNSRLSFFIPESGEYTLAATAFADFSFTGNGGMSHGSYLLTLNAPQMIGSISGQLMSASDGATPVSGGSPTYAWVQLFRCNDGFCSEYVGHIYVDLEGKFEFGSDYYGPGMLAGSFQIQAWADGYEYYIGEPFDVLEDEVIDLGGVAMLPYEFIGEVSGRLVDAQDGSPLNGFGTPWASVVLEYCDDYGCGGLASQQPDEMGNFQFYGISNQAPPGTYRVTAIADGYQESSTLSFNLAKAESIDLGDVEVMPDQIQFGEVKACETLKAGGKCEFGLKFRNRGPGRFRGQVWSLVEYYPSDQNQVTRFQVGIVGAAIPIPERVNLAVGQAVSMRFQLNIPRDVPENSLICAFAYVGAEPHPQFHSQGDRFVFCGATEAGRFEPLSEKEGRKRLRKLKERRSH